MLFRYPGGKKKLSKQIINKLIAVFTEAPDITEYREPFFGSGSIGLEILANYKLPLQNFWVNDLDTGIAAIWNTILIKPDKLKKKIDSFTPSVDSFYSFQEELLTSQISNTTDLAFKKIAIHQMSYSGLGTKAGGPIGGITQSSKYDVGCRWSPKTLHKNIDNIHEWLKRASLREGKCTSYDFDRLISDSETKALLYLDPLYYDKGNQLYQCNFSEEDHIRLAEALRKTKHKWVLSYDDCPAVRMLYQGWTNIDKITLKYTITGARTKTELLISKK